MSLTTLKIRLRVLVLMASLFKTIKGDSYLLLDRGENNFMGSNKPFMTVRTLNQQLPVFAAFFAGKQITGTLGTGWFFRELNSSYTPRG